MLYNTSRKFNHITTKVLTMNDHDTSTWFMISYHTKAINSPLISSNSTWEYVFLSSNWNQMKITLISQ